MINQLLQEVYNNCTFQITSVKLEDESQEYHACRFVVNGKSIICRNAKVTPKKNGLFVTFWKRKG